MRGENSQMFNVAISLFLCTREVVRGSLQYQRIECHTTCSTVCGNKKDGDINLSLSLRRNKTSTVTISLTTFCSLSYNLIFFNSNNEPTFDGNAITCHYATTSPQPSNELFLVLK